MIVLFRGFNWVPDNSSSLTTFWLFLYIITTHNTWSSSGSFNPRRSNEHSVLNCTWTPFQPSNIVKHLMLFWGEINECDKMLTWNQWKVILGENYWIRGCSLVWIFHLNSVHTEVMSAQQMLPCVILCTKFPRAKLIGQIVIHVVIHLHWEILE